MVKCLNVGFLFNGNCYTSIDIVAPGFCQMSKLFPIFWAQALYLVRILLSRSVLGNVAHDTVDFQRRFTMCKILYMYFFVFFP